MDSETAGTSAETSPGAPADAGSTDPIFEKLRGAVQDGGAERALSQLIESLESEKKYRELFDALLMQKRHELGLPLVQVGQATDLPPEFVSEFEEGIATACRRVGELFLKDGDIVQAWMYLRAIQESEPVREAIESIEPATRRKDIDSIVEMAIQEGIHPRRGLEMVVHHYGICSSITNFEQMRHNLKLADQQSCVGLLCASLYKDLAENIRSEIEGLEGKPVQETGLMEIIESRPKLFGEDSYFIDSSHLWSIVGFTTVLDPGPDLDRAIELADYGSRLSSMYQYESQPPFDEFYADHMLYLRGVRAAQTGDDEAANSTGEHFAAKARAALDAKNQDYPAAQILTILARLGRLQDAVQFAREFEALLGPNRPFKPDVYELCQMAEDYSILADHAREQNDPVSFAAGLIQNAAK